MPTLSYRVNVRMNKLPHLGLAMPEMGREAARGLARYGETQARTLAPVDTTALRTSTVYMDAPQGATVYSSGGAKGRVYAKFQEYGTRFHGAQPYLQPTADLAVRNAPSIVEPILRTHLGRL